MSMGKSAGGTIKFESDFAASAAVGTTVVADILWDPQQASAKIVYIPNAESWLLTDVYAVSATEATSFNPIVVFFKDTDRRLDNSKPLNTIIVTSAQRPNGLNADLEYEGGSQMIVKMINLVAHGTAADAIAYASYEKS